MKIKKFPIFLTLLMGLSGFSYAGNLNLGFLMNQKYVCINQGVMVDKKIIPIVSQEEALRHPIRIMIDSNNKLQTDGPMKNLHSVGNNTYTDGTNKIKLFVVDDKRFMVLSSSKVKDIPILHICAETDNWTVVR